MLSGTARGNEDEGWERPLEGEGTGSIAHEWVQQPGVYRTLMKGHT